MKTLDFNAAIRRRTALLAGVLLCGSTAPAQTPTTGDARPAGAPPAGTQSGAASPNVLFIAVDDLKPAFGVYGGPIRTPNIDRLAARGTTFLRAYCQQAVCSPSRTSLLTGLRPDTTRVYDLVTHFRNTIPAVVTLPQHFKNHGYFVQGMGKIYHGGLDDPVSWSVPHTSPSRPQWGPAGTAVQEKRLAEARARGEDLKKVGGRLRGPAWESVPGVADSYFHDGALADRAIATLRDVKNKPFFLAVGFIRPHLPFVAPQKYWDLYDENKISLPANYGKKPENGVPIAMHSFGELRSYDAIPAAGPVSDAQARTLIHGYYAAASYMDAQVGRVLDELDRLKLRDNTIVVLWGDHGWHLGDHGLWCKHSNFEEAAHAPLIFSLPGQKKLGARTNSLAEFVDVYPTLCAAAHLPAPSGLAGISLAALADNPEAPTKPAAFSQYPRGKTMGYSIRTDRYRYTEWGTHGAELYDQQRDPDENVNVANRPENREIVARLARQLHAAYPGAAEQAKQAQQAKRAAAPLQRAAHSAATHFPRHATRLPAQSAASPPAFSCARSGYAPKPPRKPRRRQP